MFDASDPAPLFHIRSTVAIRAGSFGNIRIGRKSQARVMADQEMISGSSGEFLVMAQGIKLPIAHEQQRLGKAWPKLFDYSRNQDRFVCFSVGIVRHRHDHLRPLIHRHQRLSSQHRLLAIAQRQQTPGYVLGSFAIQNHRTQSLQRRKIRSWRYRGRRTNLQQSIARLGQKRFTEFHRQTAQLFVSSGWARVHLLFVDRLGERFPAAAMFHQGGEDQGHHKRKRNLSFVVAAAMLFPQTRQERIIQSPTIKTQSCLGQRKATQNFRVKRGIHPRPP